MAKRIDEIVNDCKILYDYFYSNIYNSKKCKFKDSDNKTIKSFVDQLCAENKSLIFSIGKNYLLKYITFQFDYWYKLDVDKYKGGIPVNWIFGKKSALRWLTRDKEYDWTISTKEFISKEGVSVSIDSIFNSKVSRPRNVTEELEKKRYLDSDSKLANCISQTTLYSPSSRICRKCENVDKCKSLLELKFPNLFKERMCKV